MSKVQEFEEAMAEISHDQETEYKYMLSANVALLGCLNDIESDILTYKNWASGPQEYYLKMIRETKKQIKDMQCGKTTL